MLESSKYNCPILTEHNLIISCHRILMKFSENCHKLIDHSIDLYNFIQLFQELTDLLPKQKGISSIGTQCNYTGYFHSTETLFKTHNGLILAMDRGEVTSLDQSS